MREKESSLMSFQNSWEVFIVLFFVSKTPLDYTVALLGAFVLQTQYLTSMNIKLLLLYSPIYSFSRGFTYP